MILLGEPAPSVNNRRGERMAVPEMSKPVVSKPRAATYSASAPSAANHNRALASS